MTTYDSPPANSAAWSVEVFKCKHRSKHWGKGGGNKHQVQPWPHRHARRSLLSSMHPPQHGRKHQGGCGGIKHWPHGSSLPSILLANVQALDNKLDGLHAHISFQWDIRNCNVLCFTKTWLNPQILDSAIQPGGGHCVPGHGHQPARKLCDDAVLLRLPLHAGGGTAGEVQLLFAKMQRTYTLNASYVDETEAAVAVQIMCCFWYVVLCRHGVDSSLYAAVTLHVIPCMCALTWPMKLILILKFTFVLRHVAWWWCLFCKWPREF